MLPVSNFGTCMVMLKLYTTHYFLSASRMADYEYECDSDVSIVTECPKPDVPFRISLHRKSLVVHPALLSIRRKVFKKSLQR